ncbi:MAG: ECF transporter S component [Ruminococcus sp.]|uniref:ECF transporter S component n=1 Tax=Ruminococcus sp. TaxID=41978 RepID=UPI001B29FF39|nr:ECF transporter S component [Ruminococcus sp.]MBO7474873.1 ECF transporter S component [Ruminococcus sp.]
MKENSKIRSLVLLGLLTAVVALFSLTPIGSIPIGPLSITLNIIPIAIAAIALGPIGGLIMGTVFGLFSFMQCFGIGVLSGMGAATLEISPVLTFVQRVIPRALDGLLVGLIFSSLSKINSKKALSIISGIVSGIVLIGLFLSVLLLICHDENGKYKMSEGMYKFMTSGLPVALTLTGIFALGFAAMFWFVRKKDFSKIQQSCGIAGFSAAILNTIFFMGALVLLFNHTATGLDNKYAITVNNGVISEVKDSSGNNVAFTNGGKAVAIGNDIVFYVKEDISDIPATVSSAAVKFKLSSDKLKGATFAGTDQINGNSFTFKNPNAHFSNLADGKYTLKVYKKFNYIDKLRSGKSILLFIITAVGINALFEMVISTIFTALICTALFKAKLIKTPDNLKE